MPPLECRTPPACFAQPPIEMLETVPHANAVGPISLLGCGGGRPSCLPDIAPDDEDAGVADDDCGRPSDHDELEQLAGQDVACAKLSFVVSEDGPAVLAVPRLRLTRVNLHIEAARAVRVELNDAHIEDAYVELNGPITLAISDARAVIDMRVTALPSELGEPTVSMRGAKAKKAKGLVVAGPRGEGPFEGELRLQRIELEAVHLDARAIELESTVLLKARIDARERLDSTDVRIEVGEVAFGRARMAATVLNKVAVTRCGSLSFLQSTTGTASFAACSDDRARMYGSKLHDSWMNGAIEADKSSFDQVRFGVTESVELLGWETNVNVSRFCGANDMLQLSEGVVECTDCDGESLAEDESVCNIPRGFSSERNLCENLIRAPMCWPPLPVRERPGKLN